MPVYKADPSAQELLALQQAAAVLADYPITLVAPDSLAVSPYERAVPSLEVERFDDGFFVDLAAYNRLMLSAGFYSRFLARPFLLVYQLDAWVFRDELASWCARGYSYVGAPWFTASWLRLVFGDSRRMKLAVVARTRSRTVAGNGGFSLRRVDDCLAALAKESDAADRWTVNEDLFWALYMTARSWRFKIPHWKEAARFSFEEAPSEVSAATGVTVPFGCHAWQRWDPGYWRDLIPTAPEHG